MRSSTWLAIALPIGSFAAYFFALARITDPYSHPAANLAVIGLCYLGLAAVLHAGTLVAISLARPLGWLAALGSAAVLVWGLREEIFIPESGMAFTLSVGAVGVVYAVVSSWLVRWVDPRRAATTLAVAVPSLAAALLLAFHFSTSSRWHLLRHNPLIGMPAYYALARPLGDVYNTLWGRALPPPPVVPPSYLPSRERRNVVFILIDAWRADSLSAYGAEAGMMPRLDALADGCAIFDDVQANSSWTRPSVASYFSGLRPEEHGAIDRGFRLLAHSTTLAELFESRGYETAALVTNYANVGIDAGFDQGFSHFDELSSQEAPYARAEEVNAAVLRYLSGRQDSGTNGRPLFLYVHYLDPHMPYLSGLGDAGGHDGGRFSFVRRAYAEELRYTDLHVAALLRRLRRRLDSSTIYFVTADHGEELGDHGAFGHGHALHRELTHLPVLLCAPDFVARRVPGRLEARDFHDLLPRLASGERIPLEEWVVERVRARNGHRYASLYWTSSDSSIHRPEQARVVMRGIDTEKWKLLWSGYGDTYELYEAANDPLEMNNRAGELPARVAELAGEMDAAVGHWSQLQPDSESEGTLEQLRKLGYVE